MNFTEIATMFQLLNETNIFATWWITYSCLVIFCVGLIDNYASYSYIQDDVQDIETISH